MGTTVSGNTAARGEHNDDHRPQPFEIFNDNMSPERKVSLTQGFLSLQNFDVMAEHKKGTLS